MPGAPEHAHEVLKVLIVEDSPTQLAALQYLFEESHFSVITAVDGRAGLAVAKANAVDVVISDVMMPVMDGYELCKAIRADEALRHLPVILLTSLVDTREVIRGLEARANAFISKPCEDRALLALVQNVLANRELRRSPPSEAGISVLFSGQRFLITADRPEILDLLLSTYEIAVARNKELLRTRDALRVLNDQLETRVVERTTRLTAEIRERKEAGLALDASDRRYRRLFDAARDGILILDAKTGAVVDVNPFMLDLTGCSREEFLAKHLWEIGPFKDTAISRVLLAEMQAKDCVRHEVLPLATRDGRRIDVEFIGNLYRDGETELIQCNVRDTTERTRTK